MVPGAVPAAAAAMTAVAVNADFFLNDFFLSEVEAAAARGSAVEEATAALGPSLGLLLPFPLPLPLVFEGWSPRGVEGLDVEAPPFAILQYLAT